MSEFRDVFKLKDPYHTGTANSDSEGNCSKCRKPVGDHKACTFGTFEKGYYTLCCNIQRAFKMQIAEQTILGKLLSKVEPSLDEKKSQCSDVDEEQSQKDQAKGDAEESLKNRVLLVASDGTKFYTHASVVCECSPVLHRYYHGGYDAKQPNYENGFVLTDYDAETVRAMVKFMYVNAPPVDREVMQAYKEAHQNSGILNEFIKLGHFLRINYFERSIVEAVQQIQREKSMSFEEWTDLCTCLSSFDYKKALKEVFSKNTYY